ncbi:hypothetical protein PLUTE_a3716 [Pseudoalteromonas luteoviolacea DSM 6061]|nr:hypothetical protein [Pseudoalteromonas luteoviolacea DSM 6061]
MGACYCCTKGSENNTHSNKKFTMEGLRHIVYQSIVWRSFDLTIQ